MASTTTHDVHTGLWINWANGRVLGSTITLTFYTGQIFQNFLVLYLGFVSSRSWKIARFLLHRYRLQRSLDATARNDGTSPDLAYHVPKNGLYFQHQAVLRNESSDKSAAWKIFRLGYAWKSHASNPLRSSSVLLLTAVIHAAFWMAAALLVSEVATTSSPKVLVRSDRCGYVNGRYGRNQTNVEAAIDRKVAADMNAAWAYAENCYSNRSSVAVECNLPSRPQQSTSTHNATCPFPGYCLFSNTAAYSVDSGLINSNMNLGINGRSEDQINYRRVTTCAPLDMTLFKTTVNETESANVIEGQVGDPIEKFSLGTYPIWREDNVTFVFDTRQVSHFDTYSSFAITHAPTGDNAFSLIPPLNRTDGDVTILFFMANSVLYQSPIDDPMFSAHKELVASTNDSFYEADNHVTVMGCFEQHQFCHARGQALHGDAKCTALASAAQAYDNLDDMMLTDGQYDTGHRIANVIPPSSLFYIITSRPAGFVKAAETLFGILQSVNLPVNQWMVEVDAWLTASFAYLQQATVQYALGQKDLDPALLVLPSTPYEEKMCKNQIVRSTSGYTSFSLLGVLIILLLGSLIIAVGTFMENIAALVNRKIGGEHHVNAVWNADNVFQIQRKAFEGNMQGTWENKEDAEIPHTTHDEKLEYFGLEQNVVCRESVTLLGKEESRM